MRFAKPLSMALVLLGGTAAVVAFQPRPQRVMPELSQAPFETEIELLEAHPFRLAKAEAHPVLPDEPAYDRGWLLVLGTDPDLLVRRQTEEHVLFVGDQPVRRFNNGEFSGRIVVAVHGELDLTRAPAYFGEPALPERLTPADRTAQLTMAIEQGVRPFSAAAIAAVSAPQATLPDGYELGRYASYLIERHAPDEVDVVEGLRVPLLVR